MMIYLYVLFLNLFQSYKKCKANTKSFDAKVNVNPHRFNTGYSLTSKFSFSKKYNGPKHGHKAIQQKSHVYSKHYIPEEKQKESTNLVVGYYADWKANSYPPSSIPYRKLTHINYAFAVLEDETYNIKLGSSEILKEIVERSHANNVKVLLSIGGWTGSKHFSIVAEKYRKEFISQCLKLVNEYNLDGIDIDWEFPGTSGMECNTVNSEKDTENFEKLLKELRVSLDKKLITLAVRSETFYKNGSPIKDASGFYKTVDFINVMAYDINGIWNSKTAPNAPFSVTKDYESQLSFLKSIDLWTNANFKKDKIVMGVPFYGRTFQLYKELSDYKDLNVEFVKDVPKGDPTDEMWSEGCPKSIPTYSGIWQWHYLKEEILLKNVYNQTKKSSGWIRIFDQITKTPWLYHKESKKLITYDDPQSLSIKSNYVKKNGFKGLMIWSLEQDKDEELIDALQ